MTPKRPDATTLTLTLAVYSLSQQGVYTRDMITLRGNFHTDLEVPLCALEEPDGTLRIAVDLPEPPEPLPDPEPIRLSATVGLRLEAEWSIASPRLTLPENPTPKQRWDYLLAVVKHKAVR